jgi:hypothetical protein
MVMKASQHCHRYERPLPHTAGIVTTGIAAPDIVANSPIPARSPRHIAWLPMCYRNCPKYKYRLASILGSLLASILGSFMITSLLFALILFAIVVSLAHVWSGPKWFPASLGRTYWD